MLAESPNGYFFNLIVDLLAEMDYPAVAFFSANAEAEGRRRRAS